MLADFIHPRACKTICAKSLTLPKQWVNVDIAIAKAKKKFVYKPNISLPILRIRRIALIAFMLLLATGYFALTPSGRALASSIAKVVIQVFESGFTFVPIHMQDQEQAAEITETIITDYTSFGEAEKSLNRNFMQLNNRAFTLMSLQSCQDDFAGSRLYAIYETSDGLTVSLYHKWNLSGEVYGVINKEDRVWNETLSDGTVLHCFISEDGIFTALGTWNDSVVTIYADHGVDYTDVFKAIDF